MELDHPPVEILRLGARAAAICGVFAGAVRIAYTALPLSFSLGTLVWALIAGVLVSAVVVGLLVRDFEAIAGGTLATTAVIATIYGNGIQSGSLMGWSFGFATLFLASGLFWLSAWGWSQREAAAKPVRRPTEDAEGIRSS